jgi:hypothetical protein
MPNTTGLPEDWKKPRPMSVSKFIAATEPIIYLGKFWGWCLNGDRRNSFRWDSQTIKPIDVYCSSPDFDDYMHDLNKNLDAYGRLKGTWQDAHCDTTKDPAEGDVW